MKVWDYDDLRFIVGPPLFESFTKELAMAPEEAEEATAIFRERYSTIGLFENEVFPGIVEMLEELNAEVEKTELMKVFRMLPKEMASEVFAELDPESQEDIINSITDRELSEIVEDLYVDDAVDMLEEMPATIVRRVMETSHISVLEGQKVAATEDDEAAAMENTDRLDIPDGVEVYEIDGPFFFGLASRFEELEKMKKSGTKVRIIRMRKVPFIDSTGVNNLRNLCERTRKRGVTVILSGVTETVHATLVKFGVDKEIGQENIFPHIVPALAKATELVK